MSMIMLIGILVFFLLMIGLHVALGILHFREIRRIMTTEQNPNEIRTVMGRRYVRIMLFFLPLLLFVFLTSDSWDERFPLAMLSSSVATVDFTAEQLARLSEDSWQPVTPAQLRFLSFGPKQFLLRVKIPPAADSQVFVAEIPFNFLTKVEFLLAQDNKLIGQAATGMERPPAAAYHRGLYYSFDAIADSLLQRDLYVKIEGDGLILMSLKFLPEEQYQRESSLQIILIGLIIGAFLGIILYNLALFMVLRERMYLYYCAYQTTIGLFMLIYTGIAATLWPALTYGTFRVTATLQYELLLLSVIPITAFYGELLSLKSNFIWGYRLMMCIAGLSMMLMPAILFLDLGAMAIVTLTFISVSIITVVIFYLPLMNYRHVAYFITAFIGLGVGVIVHILSVFCLVPTNLIVDNMFALGALWEAVFLSLAIGDKINTMRKEQKLPVDDEDLRRARNKIDHYLGRSLASNYVPREWHVSILAVEISGFETLAEKVPSAQLYARFTEKIEEITRIVKQHGGAIDRSLGDGLLCYFGYESNAPSTQHARQAFESALKMQEATHIQHQQGSYDDELLLPLCIGIHAADVLVANLAAQGENHFTMVGGGVGLACRLGAVCSPFRILVSEAFKQVLDESDWGSAQFHEIFVSLKYQPDLYKAFECSPLSHDQQRLTLLEQAYVKMQGVGRSEVRYRNLGGDALVVRSAYGLFTLSDFSLSGLRMTGETFIGCKSLITLEIIASDEESLLPLKEAMLHKIEVEVRWCRCHNGRFEHGLCFIGLNAEQKEILLQYFLKGSATILLS